MCSAAALPCLRWPGYDVTGAGNLSVVLPRAIGAPVVITKDMEQAGGKFLKLKSFSVARSLVWSAWLLENIHEPGVFPAPSQDDRWYLSKGRQGKALQMTRAQLSLPLVDAVTHRSSQGKSPAIALSDLSAGRRIDPSAGTVVATRSRSCDWLIVCSSPPWPGQPS